MTIEHVSKFRADADEKGFITIRTGERNDSPDSDLIASVWNDDFLPLLLAAPDLLAVAIAFDSLMRQRVDEFGVLSPEMMVIVIDARAAITRATGAQS